jgi:hypothetical protein
MFEFDRARAIERGAVLRMNESLRHGGPTRHHGCWRQ